MAPVAGGGKPNPNPNPNRNPDPNHYFHPNLQIARVRPLGIFTPPGIFLSNGRRHGRGGVLGAEISDGLVDAAAHEVEPACMNVGSVFFWVRLQIRFSLCVRVRLKVKVMVKTLPALSLTLS